MRWTLYTLIGLCAFAGSAFAGVPLPEDLPTKTPLQGGWFMIGGAPGQPLSTLCGGLPCTDENFAQTFGIQLRTTVPSTDPVLFPTRSTAVNAFKDGDFSILGSFCVPGETIPAVSGFMGHSEIGSFPLAALRDNGHLQSSEEWARHYTDAIMFHLQGMGGPTEPVAFISKEDGGQVDQFSRPFAFMQLDQALYGAVRNWAKVNGFTTSYISIRNLFPTTLICTGDPML